MDLQATSTGDLAIVNGELAWVTGQDAIAQAIAFELRTGLGESRYARNRGVPWLQIIFQAGTPDYSIKAIIESTILAVEGVTSVDLAPLVIDRASRAMTVTGSAATIEGDVDFTVVIGEGI